MGTKKRVLHGVWRTKRPEEIEAAWLDPETTADNPELREVLLQLLERYGIQALHSGTPAAEARRVVLEEVITARDLRITGLKKAKRWRHVFHVLLASCGLCTIRFLFSGFLIGAVAFGSIGVLVLIAYLFTIPRINKRYGLKRLVEPIITLKQPPLPTVSLRTRSSSPPSASPPSSAPRPPPLRPRGQPVLPSRQELPSSGPPRLPIAQSPVVVGPGTPNPLGRFAIILAVVALPVMLPFLGYIVWQGIQNQAKEAYFEQFVTVEIIGMSTQELTGEVTFRVTNTGTRSIEQLDISLQLSGGRIVPKGTRKSLRFNGAPTQTFSVSVLNSGRGIGKIDVRAYLQNLIWTPRP